MMNIKHLSACLLLTLLYACSNESNAGTKLLSRFPSAQKVKVTEKNIELDSLRSPYIMTYVDSLLVFANYGYSKLLTVFNAQTGKYIGDYLNKGSGPNELIHINSLNSQNDKLIVFDGVTKTMVFYSKEKLLKNNAWDSQIRIQGDSVSVYSSFTCYPLNNDCLVVSGIIKNNRFAILDKNSKCINTFGKYPGEEKSYTANAFAYQVRTQYNLQKKIFSAACYNGENIVFYDMKNVQSPKMIKEHTGMLPVYRDTSDEHSKGVTFGKESVVGVVSLAASPEYCIALYRGKPYEGREYGGDKLILFDWETGEAVKVLQLDQVYENITYDTLNKEVVLLGTDKETYDYRVAAVSLNNK